MHIRILFLLLSSSFVSFAAQMSQPGTDNPVAEQQTSVYTRKTWTCRCYSRCFTRLCKRWSTAPVASLPADGKQSESEPIEVRTRAASRADIDLRKRGSSSAAASPTTVGRVGSPLPLYTMQSDRRLSSVPNSSFQPLPGLLDA
jgi:hypothetical protein